MHDMHNSLIQCKKHALVLSVRGAWLMTMQWCVMIKIKGLCVM
jgi:hypothetical protein